MMMDILGYMQDYGGYSGCIGSIVVDIIGNR